MMPTLTRRLLLLGIATTAAVATVFRGHKQSSLVATVENDSFDLFADVTVPVKYAGTTGRLDFYLYPTTNDGTYVDGHFEKPDPNYFVGCSMIPAEGNTARLRGIVIPPGSFKLVVERSDDKIRCKDMTCKTWSPVIS